VQFRLRDWLISRQRYWGCPIPMVHCATCGIVPVPEDQLPVLLPENVTNWIPKGRSPLADVPEFVNTTCPKCGGAAQRDVDTMDTFIDSSWYHLRYVDPHNPDQPFDPAEARKWLPIGLYIGGATHANGHLIYFRFFTKVLHDAGWVEVDEPVVRMFHHGMVEDAQGRTMSKSLGNVVSPIDMMRSYGADAARLAMFFFAPSDAVIRWNEEAIVGARKLVQRVFDVVNEFHEIVKAFPADIRANPASEAAKTIRRAAHEFVRRTDQAFRTDLAFNPAIAAVYELLNVFPSRHDVASWKDEDLAAVAESLRILVRGLAPFAPHLCDELHARLGGTGTIFRESWPQVDPAALRRDEVEIAVQVNGKIRERINVPADADEAAMRSTALALPRISAEVAGRTPKKVIVVKNRLVNVIV
jgi:leucyl-tRNA synthetase